MTNCEIRTDWLKVTNHIDEASVALDYCMDDEFEGKVTEHPCFKGVVYHLAEAIRLIEQHKRLDKEHEEELFREQLKEYNKQSKDWIED